MLCAHPTMLCAHPGNVVRVIKVHLDTHSYTAVAALWIGYFFCLLDPHWQGPVVSMLAGLLQAPVFAGSANGNVMLTGVLACMCDGCIPIVSHAEQADEEGGHDTGEELW